jgi:hypothetical protein
MRAEEIIKALPKLSIEGMKEVALALREAMEDRADLIDVIAVFGNPGTPIPVSEVRKKQCL